MAAPLVRRSRGVLVGGCTPVRAAAGVHPGAGRAGQGDRLHTAEGRRAAVVPLVVPGTGPASGDFRSNSCGSCRPIASLEQRGACQLTSTIGDPRSHGSTSNSWIAEPVTLDSSLAPGAELTPRLMQCTTSGAPPSPAASAALSWTYPGSKRRMKPREI